MPPSPEKRELAATALAFVGHAGVLVLALAIAPSRPASVQVVDSRAERWFELELEPSTPAARAGVIPREPAPAVAGERVPSSRRIESRPTSRGEPEGPAPAGSAEAAAAPPSPRSSGDVYDETPVDPILALPPGVGGFPVWSVPGAVAGPGPAPAAPTAGAPAPDVPRDVAGQVLRGTVGGSDRDKGLTVPAGGITARAIEDAARRVTLPHDCRASFEVRVGANGEVLGVRVLSSSAGDAAAWERVARGASAALAAKRSNMAVRMRRGATVVVRLESRYVYPSGSADPSYSDLASNKSDYFSSTYTVLLVGDKPLPPGPVTPIDRRSPYTKALPTHVAPVEMKPLLPDR